MVDIQWWIQELMKIIDKFGRYLQIYKICRMPCFEVKENFAERGGEVCDPTRIQQ